MKKQTVLDQIEITRDGHVMVRFAKEIVDDDGTVLGKEYNRTALPPGLDVDAQMALVNQHLSVGLKCAPVGKGCIDRVKVHAGAAWSKDVVAAYKAKVEAEHKAKASMQPKS